jgi:hypothetical protein
MRASRAQGGRAKIRYIRRVELRTATLLLRRFQADDVDDALAYRDDPEFARFLPHIPQPFTRAPSGSSRRR